MFEIGASLREARLRQGLDFPEIETGTKIRGKYLQALEEERFDVLPGDTYIKGFLRTYAEYLGLDGQLYVDEFNSRYVMPEEVQTIRARRTAQARRHRQVQGSVLVAALAGIAIVTALVIVAWRTGSPSPQSVAGLSGKNPKHKHHARAQRPRVPIITLRAVGTNVDLLAVHRGSPTGPTVAQNKELPAGHIMRFRARVLWINTGTPQYLRVFWGHHRLGYPPANVQAFTVSASGITPSA